LRRFHRDCGDQPDPPCGSQLRAHIKAQWSSQKNHERSKTAKVVGQPDLYLHANVAVAAIVVLLPSPGMPKASRPQRPGAETWASFDLH
jgi:hypothetical protein